jgi:flagellar protein FlaI
VRFLEHGELDNFVINLAQKSGKSISIATPVLDATLPDGSRLNETLGTEVTTRGSSFTIRKFKEDPLTVSDLVKSKTLSGQMAAHLWLAVQFGESMICSGGTASGKTTTLNAVSHFIPPSAKIITIEDTREMNLPHENWIAGLTREKKSEEGGQSIDMFTLLVAALRQRPEYMIVGEVRGKETMAVFQAMATGQITYSTIHADSVPSIVHRLENPPINIPRILILGLNLIMLQAQVRVKGKRTRRIKELVEVIGIEPTSNEIITNTVYKWMPAKDEFKYSGHSKLYEKIMERENLTAEEVLEEIDRRAKIIEWMMKKGLRRHVEVASVINEYYRDPKTVVERVKKELAEIDAMEAEAA